MKITILLLITVTAVLTQEYYDASTTSYFDTLDIEVLLKNEKIMKELIDCALDKGPCNELFQKLKGT